MKLKNRTTRAAKQVKRFPSRRAMGGMARRDREAMLARIAERETNQCPPERTP
jgi:hypothetical protein